MQGKKQEKKEKRDRKSPAICNTSHSRSRSDEVGQYTGCSLILFELSDVSSVVLPGLSGFLFIFGGLVKTGASIVNHHFFTLGSCGLDNLVVGDNFRDGFSLLCGLGL